MSSNLTLTLVTSASESTLELQKQAARAETAIVQNTRTVKQRVADLEREGRVSRIMLKSAADKVKADEKLHQDKIDSLNGTISQLNSLLAQLNGEANTLEAECSTLQQRLNTLNSPAGINERCHMHRQAQVEAEKRAIAEHQRQQEAHKAQLRAMGIDPDRDRSPDNWNNR